MAIKKFQFDLYRLNVVDDEEPATDTYISTDDQIAIVLGSMTNGSNDIPVSARKTTIKWGLRSFQTFLLPGERCTETVHRVLLIRALEEQDGVTLTDAGLSAARSAITPPLATSVSLHFWMRRHLVAVEHNAVLLSGTAWRHAFQSISGKVARRMQFSSSFALEAVPEAGTLTALLNTFTRITRIKAKVRIPNPDLTRYTRELYERLRESRIREYRQDMHNRQDGLNVAEGTLARTTVALAEEGYKDGDVTFVGVRHAQVETVIFGQTAARGTLKASKEEVRLLTPNDDSVEVKAIVGALVGEINRIKPPEARSTAE